MPSVFTPHAFKSRIDPFQLFGIIWFSKVSRNVNTCFPPYFSISTIILSSFPGDLLSLVSGSVFFFSEFCNSQLRFVPLFCSWFCQFSRGSYSDLYSSVKCLYMFFEICSFVMDFCIIFMFNSINFIFTQFWSQKFHISVLFHIYFWFIFLSFSLFCLLSY